MVAYILLLLMFIIQSQCASHVFITEIDMKTIQETGGKFNS